MITALTPAGTSVILIIIEKRSLIFYLSTYTGSTYPTVQYLYSDPDGLFSFISFFCAYLVIRPNNKLMLVHRSTPIFRRHVVQFNIKRAVQ